MSRIFGAPWTRSKFASALIELGLKVAIQARRHDLTFLAAGLAFYSFLALIPLLLLLVLSYSLIAEPATAVRHVRFLTSFISSEAAKDIGDLLMKLVLDTQERKGIGVLASLVVALYAGVRGARAVTKALDILHETECKRSFAKAILVSTTIVLSALLVGTSALIAIAALGYVEKAVAGISPLLALVIKAAAWIGAAVVASVAISALYRHAPSVPHPRRHRWWSAGAVAATLAWCIATLMLGVYVANFSRYDAVYGSAATIVVMLMWFYISAVIVLAGAEIDIALNPAD